MPRFRLLDRVRIYVVPFKIRLLIGSHTGVDILYIYIISNSWTEGWWTCGKKIEVASYLSWKKAWSAFQNLHTKSRFPITMEIQSCKHFLGQPWIYTQCIMRGMRIWEVLTSLPWIQLIAGTCGAIAAAQTTIYPYLSPKWIKFSLQHPEW